MRRLRYASAVLAGGLLAVGGMATATLAQGASPMTMADSPLVGAWIIDTDVNDPGNPPIENIFHADGTIIQVGNSGAQANGPGNAIGAWEPTGPNTAAATLVSYQEDDKGAVSKTTVRATLEVAADGQSLTADYTLEFTGPDGTSSGQLGPGKASGTRISVEPMGSPVAPLGPPPSATPSATP
jgi:hypothetical protein